MTVFTKEEEKRLVSLPIASDMARSEAIFVTEAAQRVADHLVLIEAAVREGQRRIMETEIHIQHLLRNNYIDRGPADELLKRLLRPDERG